MGSRFTPPVHRNSLWVVGVPLEEGVPGSVCLGFLGARDTQPTQCGSGFHSRYFTGVGTYLQKRRINIFM